MGARKAPTNNGLPFEEKKTELKSSAPSISYALKFIPSENFGMRGFYELCVGEMTRQDTIRHTYFHTLADAMYAYNEIPLTSATVDAYILRHYFSDENALCTTTEYTFLRGT